VVIFIFSIILKVFDERFFNGIPKEVIVSKDGVYSGYKIKKLKEFEGKKCYGVSGDWFVVDGTLYYKDKEVFKKDEMLSIEKYKEFILCLSIPSNIIYLFSKGFLKDSIDTGIENISGMQVLDDIIYLFKGGDGRVLKMDLKGKITEFLRLPVSNVLGITKDKNKLYLYTYNPGRVYEYENGKLRLFYDPNITEINGVFFLKDTVYITGNNELGTNIEGNVILLYNGIEKVVYRGTPIISSYLTDIGFLCGENEDGQIGLFTRDGFKIIADLDDKEIIGIKKDGDKILVLTGENAGIYEIKKEFSKEGEYETEVIDGGYGVIWGKINYEGKGDFKIFYRTGKTNKVDSTWKDWEEYNGRISSEDRYLKLKFRLMSGRDTINEIMINFNEKNRAPEITKFMIFPPGIGYGSSQNVYPGPSLQPQDINNLRDRGFDILEGSYFLDKNKRCIYWELKDEDNDNLFVKLFIFDGSRWRLLQDNIQGNSFVMDGLELVEGYQKIKIVVYDAEDSVYKILDFLNDFSPPEIISYRIDDKFHGVSKDKFSEIWSITYKFDGDDFYRKARPEDGVFDDTLENFYFPIDKTKDNVTIRIEDRLGNIKVETIKIR